MLCRCSEWPLEQAKIAKPLVRCLTPFCPPDQSFYPPRGLYTGRAMKSYISNLTYHLSAPNTRTSVIHPFHLPGRSFALLAAFAAILAVFGLSSCTGHTSAAGTSPATPSTAGPAVSTTPGLVITTSSLPAGQPQSPYAAQLGATGGTASYSWSVSSGNLPAGLTISNSGAISGTPTQSGTFAFSMSVQDSGTSPQSTSQAFSISIDAAAPKSTLQITTTSLPAGQGQAPYSGQLGATGGTASYRWSLSSGSLPAGMTLSNSGAISGTPAQSGTFPFSMSVKDSSSPPQSASQAFTMTIAARSTLQITTTSLPAGQGQAAYTARLGATGGTAPYSWNGIGGSLPPGLTLNASTGNIAGAPTKTGAFSVTMQVTDSAAPPQTAALAFSMTISASPLQITTSSLPGGAVGVGYSTTLAATNGVSPYTWSLHGGQLPPGLSLQGSNGQISGMPSQTGAFSFSVQARDSAGQTASGNLNANIAPVSAPLISSVAPKSGPTSAGTSVTVNGSNFHAGATVLFGGVTASSVTVSGATQIQVVTPVHIAGTIDVTVRNTDNQSSTLSSSFTFNVALPTITSVSPNTGSTDGGTTMTITGTNFQAGAVVSIGPASASTVTLNSATQIQAVTPATNAAGAVSVSVQNPDGHTATLAGGFDYSKPQSGGYIFQDGFEAGDLSAWTSGYGNGLICSMPGGSAQCGLTPNNSMSFVHSGLHSAQLHYTIPASISGNQDINVALVKNFKSPGLKHFHIRGYVMLHNNGGNLSSGADIQRKLYYLKHYPSGGNMDWDVILTTHSNGGSSMQLAVLIDSGNNGRCLGQQGYYANTGAGLLRFDQWYSLEMEAQLSDLGQRNGLINVWVDGNLITLADGNGVAPSAIENRCSGGTPDSDGLNSFEIGEQADRAGSVAIDEFRYWDDIVVSDSYIGLKQ